MAFLQNARSPDELETYSDYLHSFGLFAGTGFVFREVVRDDTRHAAPPRWMWPRMVPTMALAVDLRERVVCAGATGLVVRAAYRPAGGEADSQHKHNAALDLDLLASDLARQPFLAYEFSAIAAVLWREHRDLRAGLGTYAPDGEIWTRRVHLDTHSVYGFRCWQGLPGGGFSKRPAALRLSKLEHDDPEYLACVADGRPRP